MISSFPQCQKVNNLNTANGRVPQYNCNCGVSWILDDNDKIIDLNWCWDWAAHRFTVIWNVNLQMYDIHYNSNANVCNIISNMKIFQFSKLIDLRNRIIKLQAFV